MGAGRVRRFLVVVSAFAAVVATAAVPADAVAPEDVVLPEVVSETTLEGATWRQGNYLGFHVGDSVVTALMRSDVNAADLELSHWDAQSGAQIGDTVAVDFLEGIGLHSGAFALPLDGGRFLVTLERSLQDSYENTCLLAVVEPDGSVSDATFFQTVVRGYHCRVSAPVNGGNGIGYDFHNDLVVFTSLVRVDPDDAKSERLVVHGLSPSDLSVVWSASSDGHPFLYERLDAQTMIHPDGSVSVVRTYDDFRGDGPSEVVRLYPDGTHTRVAIPQAATTRGYGCAVDNSKALVVARSTAGDVQWFEVRGDEISEIPPANPFHIWDFGHCVSRGDGLVVHRGTGNAFNEIDLMVTDAASNELGIAAIDPTHSTSLSHSVYAVDADGWTVLRSHGENSPTVLRVSWPTGETTPPACPYGDVTVVSARGSGDNANGTDYPGHYGFAVQTALSAVVEPDVNVELFGVDYDAVSVDAIIESAAATAAVAPTSPLYLTNLAAAIGGATAVYAPSVETGRSSLAQLLSDISEVCGTDHPTVLAGYSQGAHVVQLVLEDIAGEPVANMVAAVGLVASPMYTRAADDSARGSAYLSATGVASAFVGTYSTAPIDPEFTDRTRTWCLIGDPVCDLVVDNVVEHLDSGGDVHSPSVDGDDYAEAGALIDFAGMAAWHLGVKGIPVLPVSTPPAVVNSISAMATRTDSGLVVGRRAGIGSALEVVFAWDAGLLVGDGGPFTTYRVDTDADGSYETTQLRPYGNVTLSHAGNPNQLIRFLLRVEATGPRGHSVVEDFCFELRGSDLLRYQVEPIRPLPECTPPAS